jgi:hypothetical protein
MTVTDICLQLRAAFTGTGGGFTAYRVELSNNNYMLITSGLEEREAQCPIDSDESCSIGIYTDDGDMLEYFDNVRFESLYAFLRDMPEWNHYFPAGYFA